MSALSPAMAMRRTHGLVQSITLYDVATASVFVGILAVAVLPRFDTDIWWHLFVGRHILAHGVPAHDFLSFTVPGHSWIDHEWLTEAGMYLAYQLGGLRLVVSLFGIVTVAAFLIMYLVMRVRGVNTVLALGVTVLAAAATAGGWGPRIQMVSLLFAAGFCLALERYRTTAGPEWLIAMVLAMWLWSNLHGGFVVGLLLIAAHLVGGTFDRVQGGMSWRQAFRCQRSLLACLAAAIVVTLINPNTYRQLLYPLRFLTPNAFTNVIQESQSPNFHLYQLLPFEVMLLGLIVSGLLVRRRVSWIDILLCAGVTHLALQQNRNVALWCVVVGPLLAVYAQEASQPVTERWRQLNQPVRWGKLWMTNWLLLTGVIAGGLSLLVRADTATSVRAAEIRMFPAGAVAYIEHRRMQGRMFNSYSYGGYLIWKTGARYPDFIDPRADTVFTDQTLSHYLTIYGAKPGWRELLRKYRIRWVFVERDAPIAAVLSEIKNWHVSFRGRMATIMVYKDGKNV